MNKLDDIPYYVIYNNQLYCRQYEGKGWLSNYLGKYDIYMEDLQENKISYKITSYYTKDPDGCENFNLSISSCAQDSIYEKDTDFVIEKVDGNWVVTSYNLHG